MAGFQVQFLQNAEPRAAAREQNPRRWMCASKYGENRGRARSGLLSMVLLAPIAEQYAARTALEYRIVPSIERAIYRARNVCPKLRQREYEIFYFEWRASGLRVSQINCSFYPSGECRFFFFFFLFQTNQLLRQISRYAIPSAWIWQCFSRLACLYYKTAVSNSSLNSILRNDLWDWKAYRNFPRLVLLPVDLCFA